MSNLITVKVNKNRKYTTIHLTCVEDPRLSWGAKGLHLYLLSRPDNWSINKKDLVSRATNGKDSMYSHSKELINFGYLVINQSKRESGRFNNSEWVAFEIPEAVPPDPENPDAVKPDPDIQTISNKQVNNKHSSNKQYTIPPNPQGETVGLIDFKHPISTDSIPGYIKNLTTGETVPIPKINSDNGKYKKLTIVVDNLNESFIETVPAPDKQKFKCKPDCSRQLFRHYDMWVCQCFAKVTSITPKIEDMDSREPEKIEWLKKQAIKNKKTTANKEQFEACYKIYPSKPSGKEPSWKVWKQLKPNPQIVYEAIEKWKQTDQWVKGYFPRSFETFLRRKLYEADFSTIQTAKSSTPGGNGKSKTQTIQEKNLLAGNEMLAEISKLKKNLNNTPELEAGSDNE